MVYIARGLSSELFIIANLRSLGRHVRRWVRSAIIPSCWVRHWFNSLMPRYVDDDLHESLANDPFYGGEQSQPL